MTILRKRVKTNRKIKQQQQQQQTLITSKTFFSVLKNKT